MSFICFYFCILYYDHLPYYTMGSKVSHHIVLVSALEVTVENHPSLCVETNIVCGTGLIKLLLFFLTLQVHSRFPQSYVNFVLLCLLFTFWELM